MVLKLAVLFGFSGMLLLRKHLGKIQEFISLGIEKLLIKLKYGRIPKESAFMPADIHLYHCVAFVESAF